MAVASSLAAVASSLVDPLVAFQVALVTLVAFQVALVASAAAS